MTTRPRGASLEQESASFEEGVGDLSVEEKYVEVKQLDRQGEVDIAKRIEKGERKVYKALSQNRIILEEILKIHESAKKDTRVIKEMIDLAMPEDEDEIDMAALSAGALTKIADIMVIFDKVARLDKRMKDTKAKLNEKKLSQRALANIHKTIDR